MTSTERKRAWRLRHPELSRAAERQRAQARRDGIWGGRELGSAPRPCPSHESYWRHENSWGRLNQRLWYPRLGAGAHRLTQAERREAIARRFAEKRAELGIEPGVTLADLAGRGQRCAPRASRPHIANR